MRRLLPRSRIWDPSKQTLIRYPEPPGLVERPRSVGSSPSLPAFLPLPQELPHQSLIPKPFLECL